MCLIAPNNSHILHESMYMYIPSHPIPSHLIPFHTRTLAALCTVNQGRKVYNGWANRACICHDWYSLDNMNYECVYVEVILLLLRWCPRSEVAIVRIRRVYYTETSCLFYVVVSVCTSMILLLVPQNSKVTEFLSPKWTMLCWHWPPHVFHSFLEFICLSGWWLFPFILFLRSMVYPGKYSIRARVCPWSSKSTIERVCISPVDDEWSSTPFPLVKIRKCLSICSTIIQSALVLRSTCPGHSCTNRNSVHVGLILRSEGICFGWEPSFSDIPSWGDGGWGWPRTLISFVFFSMSTPSICPLFALQSHTLTLQ